MRFQRKTLWWRREKGPKGNLSTRRETIKSKYPAFTDEELDKLSVGTVCMGKEQVMQGCEQYIKTKVFPQNEYKWGMVSVGAESGYFDENLLHPKKLKKELEQLGFEVDIYAFWGRRNKAIKMVNSLISALTPISIFLVPSFRIIARKI